METTIQSNVFLEAHCSARQDSDHAPSTFNKYEHYALQTILQGIARHTNRYRF